MSNFLKRAIVCGMLSTLTGCLYQSVDSVDIYYAEKYCKDLRESRLYSIGEYWTGESTVTCENGDYLPKLSSYKEVQLRQLIDERK